MLATVERADLQAALERLSRARAGLLAMRYEEDLTQPAIAARLGIPEGTVKVQLHRARAQAAPRLRPRSQPPEAPVHVGERAGPKFGPLDKDALGRTGRLFST